MGSSSWSNDAYSHLKTSYTTKSTDDIFANNKKGKASADMSPKGLSFRESRDSTAHPETLAVLVWLDVTGSMGRIPETLVREKLGTLMQSLIEHDINDAQVLFGCIGDHISDKFPLQVGQFESGTDELNKWLTSAYLEGNGGGQQMESYLLSWLVGARHTSIDCFEKRGIKGLLFTIGDEASWDNVSKDVLKDLMGYTQADNVTDKELLAEVQRMYHVFHIHVNEGSYKNDPKILAYWKGLLNERLIVCENHLLIAEIIATTVAIIHGVDIDNFTKQFDNKTAGDVKNALMRIDTHVAKRTDKVITL